jgi:hypothetical protein
LEAYNGKVATTAVYRSHDRIAAAGQMGEK